MELSIPKPRGVLLNDLMFIALIALSETYTK